MSKNVLAGIAVVVALLCGVLVWSIWAQGMANRTDLPTQKTTPVTGTPTGTTTDSIEASTSVEIGEEPGTTASVEVVAE